MALDFVSCLVPRTANMVSADAGIFDVMRPLFSFPFLLPCGVVVLLVLV